MASGEGCLLLLPGLGNLIICYDECLKKFGNYVEKQRIEVQRYLCAFLVSTYLHSHKKVGALTF
jgi:hypothetical protein